MTLSARPLGLSSTGEYQLQTVMAWTSTLASLSGRGDRSFGMLLPPVGEHPTQPLFGTTPDDLVELEGLSPRLEVGERLSSAPRSGGGERRTGIDDDDIRGVLRPLGSPSKRVASLQRACETLEKEHGSLWSTKKE